MDKRSTTLFECFLFSDFDLYSNIPENPPQYEPQPLMVMKDLYDFMKDSRGRDQFLTHSRTKSHIFFNETLGLKPELAFESKVLLSI